MTNQNDNFTQLKQLFDVECAHVEGQLKDQHHSTEYPQGAANVLAKLLDGYPISIAKYTLKKAGEVLDCNCKVKSDEIPPTAIW